MICATGSITQKEIFPLPHCAKCIIALDEIENILIENRRIPADTAKKYSAPKLRDDSTEEDEEEE
jgi:hypothetical protein